MKSDQAAEKLSHCFSSFRKSEQVLVYERGTVDVALLVEALDIHLRAIAAKTKFETYQLDRLGEWVGWCFPNHTDQLDILIEKAIKKHQKSPSKLEVFSFFNKGLKLGRQDARIAIKDGSAPTGNKVIFEVVHPA